MVILVVYISVFSLVLKVYLIHFLSSSCTQFLTGDDIWPNDTENLQRQESQVLFFLNFPYVK